MLWLMKFLLTREMKITVTYSFWSFFYMYSFVPNVLIKSLNNSLDSVFPMCLDLSFWRMQEQLPVFKYCYDKSIINIGVENYFSSWDLLYERNFDNTYRILQIYFIFWQKCKNNFRLYLTLNVSVDLCKAR